MSVPDPLVAHVPDTCRDLLAQSNTDLRSSIPDLAKDDERMAQVDSAVASIPTDHAVHEADARDLSMAAPESVDLIVTSPPYFDIKDYGDDPPEGQLGDCEDFDAFVDLLDDVWQACFDALVPGGRLCAVVGDVMRSRSTHGRHRVLPLHAIVQQHCRAIGFDTLAPIIWYKIGNASLEAGDSARFLGKPYEPGAVIKNDVEYVLLCRKPGAYRSPSTAQRILSTLSVDRHRRYFRQIWDDINGEPQTTHPAPFPPSLAERLIRMFSFVGDTVLDPFVGSGSAPLAASRVGRDSLSVDIEPSYVDLTAARLDDPDATVSVDR